ncbi:ABC transporter permease [Agromyces archimandritae]|uniref:ABC transporter permease n=1 Tax=Agromyces archimandritae TaxID=2781962 RepID=A0A975FQV8_9MICO|nr:ABC transporter permease [Agromyces archimandritae]
MGFWRGTGLIVALDLRQRVRGVAWYVLLGIFVFLIFLVAVLLTMATDAWEAGGGGVFSTIVFFVLLLGTLVSPAMSGNAINGDREQGTLATTQVTLVTTGQIVVGKWIAAWLTALAFLAAAVPFLVYGLVLGGVSGWTIALSIFVTAVELGVVAAVGVGLSGVLVKPLFSVVVTYLVVAALSIGTLIAFGLGGTAVQSTATVTQKMVDWSKLDANGEVPGGGPVPCLPTETNTYQVPRYDLVWGFLAANPYVVVADAAATDFTDDGEPRDLFGWISVAVRQAQQPPELDQVIDACATFRSGEPESYESQTPKEIFDAAVPSWFVGLGIHVLLGAGALWWAWARTRTPAKRLSAGSRIA